CGWALQRRVNRSICYSHRAAAEFPQRSIVASLNPVISESIRYGRKQGFVRFFRAVKSDAEQANHAAPEIGGESSLQPCAALRTDRRASRLCLHYPPPALRKDVAAPRQPRTLP